MAFDRQPTLAGELVVLRPIRPGDFDALHAAAADPLVWTQHPEPDRWRQDVFRRYFNDHLASRGALVVLDRAGDVVIGASRFDNLDERRSEVEIGWTFLARPYWGGPHNADLKHLMLTHAFRSLSTVVFLVDEHNFRSRRAVEKLGACQAGRRRGQVLYELRETAYLAVRTTAQRCVVDSVVRAMCEHDLEAFIACYAAGARIEDAAGTVLAAGQEQIRLRYEEMFRRHPSLLVRKLARITIGDFVVQEEQVVGRAPQPERHIAIYQINNSLIADERLLR